MARYVIDPAASKILVHTFAEGMLARLAHDLEIASERVEGTATADGDSWSAALQVDPASLRVIGVVRGGRVDPSALSASDRAEIERRMRADVFSVGSVIVTARGQSRTHGEASLNLGRTATARATIELTVTDAPGGGLHATGCLPASLKALGAPPIKGPLGAFRVKDEVEIRFDLALRPAD